MIFWWHNLLFWTFYQISHWNWIKIWAIFSGSVQKVISFAELWFVKMWSGKIIKFLLTLYFKFIKWAREFMIHIKYAKIIWGSYISECGIEGNTEFCGRWNWVQSHCLKMIYYLKSSSFILDLSKITRQRQEWTQCLGIIFCIRNDSFPIGCLGCFVSVMNKRLIIFSFTSISLPSWTNFGV